MEEMILEPLISIISMNYATTALTRTCIESVISLRTTELTFKIRDKGYLSFILPDVQIIHPQEILPELYRNSCQISVFFAKINEQALIQN